MTETPLYTPNSAPMIGSSYHVGWSTSTGDRTPALTMWIVKDTDTGMTLAYSDKSGLVNAGIDGSKLGTMEPAGVAGNLGASNYVN